MGGFISNVTDGNDLMNAYDIQYDNWSLDAPAGGPFNKLSRGQSMFATTRSTGEGLGFIAGGTDWTPGMVTFNASDPKSLSWTNTTDNIPFFRGPATEHVRFGDKGVLVSVGGSGNFNNSFQRDMSQIQVYDIESGQWFQVTADGDVPSTRSQFCSGLSSAPDDSSFQMTVYGGYNGYTGSDTNEVLSDVYVLTMPAFRWINVTNNEYINSNTTEIPRSRRHLCNVYEDRQMIVLGGDFVDALQVPIDGANCDKYYPPIKMLDTSTYTWQTQFPLPNSTYEVPKQVYSVIGGGPDGGATMTGPDGGFNATAGKTPASAIAALFSKRVPRYNAATGSSASPSTIDPTQSNVSRINLPKKPNTGLIVGVTLGSIGLVLSVLGLSFLAWRRRKARLQAVSMHPDWIKAELPDDSPFPNWAKQRPAGFRSHEMYGDDLETTKPKELMAHDIRVMPCELDGTAASRVISISKMSAETLSRIRSSREGIPF